MLTVDEEEGVHMSGISICDSVLFSSSSIQRNSGDFSRQLSTTSTNVSESEYFDHVSEVTPLVGDNAELAPPIDVQQRPLSRISSEESIHTVTALPGMIIRCHSINTKASGRRDEGVCTIRPSTTKVALKAVQTDRRAARNRQQNALPSEKSFGAKENYWIDIETPQRSTDELYEFLKQLRLPRFFVSILSEPSNWTTEVIPLKQACLAIFQILPNDPNSDEIAHAALLSMPRLLVTFSTFPRNDGAGRFYELVSQYMKQRERVPEPSNSGSLLAWLQFHVRRTSEATRELRLATVEMDKALDRDLVHFEFEQLVEAKKLPAARSFSGRGTT